MTNKKRSFSTIQLITIILIGIYGIWEKNVQQHLNTHPEDGSLERMDLWLIIPILAVLSCISIWQLLKK